MLNITNRKCLETFEQGVYTYETRNIKKGNLKRTRNFLLTTNKGNEGEEARCLKDDELAIVEERSR